MVRLIYALTVTLGLLLTLAPSAQALELTFMVGDAERRAIVVNEAPKGKTRPVVIVLHGGSGSAEDQQRRTGFDAIARREGFTVVYAEGTAYGMRGFHAWNTGYLLRNQVSDADDIAYFDKLIDMMIRKYGGDAKRVYMTGGSNGGMMTFVYAVKRPEKLAAVAPVVGAMFSFSRKPAVPLPIMMINGGADNEVPIAGGMSKNPMVRRTQAEPFKPLSETVSFWVKANRSTAKPMTVTDGTVTTKTYAADAGGAVTISIVDSVGGHGWPGTEDRRADNTPIQSFDGAEKVWSFFKTQKRKP